MKVGVLKYKDIEKVMPGRVEFGRLYVSKGPEKGTVFVFEDSAEGSFVLGRGEFTDLQILDSKSSRRHAEFWIDGDTMNVRDLHSSNGVKVNRRLIKAAFKLRSGDKILLGSSELEWSYQIEAKELKNVVASEVRRNIAKRSAEMKPLFSAIKEGHAEGPVKFGEEPKNVKTKGKSKGGMIAVLAIALFVLWYGDDGLNTGEKIAKVSGKPNPKRLLAGGSNIFTEKPSRAPASLKHMESDYNAKIHLHRGMRELRERNYSRAMGEFTTALSIQPRMPEAMTQLATARKLMTGEMNNLVKLGNLEKKGGRYAAAANHYCQVMKLIKSDPDGAVDAVKDKAGKMVRGQKFESVRKKYEDVLIKMGKEIDQDHCQI